MLILNHSCKIQDEIRTQFLDFIRNIYLPDFISEVSISHYQCYALTQPQETDDSTIIILQLFLKDTPEDQNAFLRNKSVTFNNKLVHTFGNKAISFLTLMEELVFDDK